MTLPFPDSGHRPSQWLCLSLFQSLTGQNSRCQGFTCPCPDRGRRPCQWLVAITKNKQAPPPTSGGRAFPFSKHRYKPFNINAEHLGIAFQRTAINQTTATGDTSRSESAAFQRTAFNQTTAISAEGHFREECSLAGFSTGGLSVQVGHLNQCVVSAEDGHTFQVPQCLGPSMG